MIGPVKNSNAPKDKAKTDKKVSDDYYDRVNYYEARNIFSSNEPFNPNNRLYTDHVSNTHSVWNTIQQPHERHLFDQFSNIGKELSGINNDITKSNMSDFSRYIVSGSSTACKICGYVGHLAYQCRNKIVLKNKKKIEDEEKEKMELQKFVSQGMN